MKSDTAHKIPVTSKVNASIEDILQENPVLAEAARKTLINIDGLEQLSTNAESVSKPVDQFSTRDISTIITALRLYHGDLLDTGASLRDLEHVATLSRRIADPGKEWKAEAPS
jgi:hypothetical protein